MQPFGAFCAGSQFLVQPCPTDREVLLPTRSNWNYLSSDTSEKHVPRWIIWEVYSLSHISHDEWLWPCFYNSALQKTSNKPRHSTSPKSKAAIELLTLRVNNVGFPNIASGDSFSNAKKNIEKHIETLAPKIQWCSQGCNPFVLTGWNPFKSFRETPLRLWPLLWRLNSSLRSHHPSHHPLLARRVWNLLVFVGDRWKAHQDTRSTLSHLEPLEKAMLQAYKHPCLLEKPTYTPWILFGLEHLHLPEGIQRFPKGQCLLLSFISIFSAFHTEARDV